MLVGQNHLFIGGLPQDIVCLLEEILFLGGVKCLPVTMVSGSSTKLEYRIIKNLMREPLWIQDLLAELGFILVSYNIVL